MEMRRLILSSLLLAFAASSLLAAMQPAVTKTIEKRFEVPGDARVEIVNSFGEVRVTSWDEPTVAVKIEVRTFSKRESRAKDMLDRIDVNFSESSYRLLMKTDIDVNTKGDEKFEVNYEVKVPDANRLKIGNSFGDIVLDSRREVVDIDLSYGDLKAAQLSGGGEVRIAFGNGQITSLRDGRIILRYSERFSLQNATTLELDQEYSEIEIEEVQELDLRGRFGEIAIDKADVIEGDLQFTGFSLETLSGALKLDCKHTSNFTIDNVLASFTLIDIDGNFGSYEIDLEDDLDAEFEAKFQFAELRSYGVDMDFSRKITEKNDSEYKARIGKGDPNRIIRIYSTHGDVRLTQ